MIIKLECDEREAQALVTLIDAAVRASGIRGAGDAIAWVVKIEEALRVAQGIEASSPLRVGNGREAPGGHV